MTTLVGLWPTSDDRSVFDSADARSLSFSYDASILDLHRALDLHLDLHADLYTMPEDKQVEWRLPPPVANADPGSIFLDKRPVTRRSPNPLAHPTLDDAKSRCVAVSHRQEPWMPTHVPSVRFPDTIKAFAHGGTSPSSPERWDVHQQTHVGGNSGTVAAGVRTQTGPSSSAPWVVQTGKPPGGWSVAGSMAEGW